MPAPDPSPPDELDDLRRRIDLLERDNQRLRENLEPLLGPDNPSFNARAFQKIFGRSIGFLFLPMYLSFILVPLFFALVPAARSLSVAGIPILNTGTGSSRAGGLGVGIVALGGFAVGGLSVGGLSIGLVALGGGAVGLIAIGGGSLGVIAVGGGACGFIAIGGGAAGYYALGQRGAGRYVFALNRQDPEAVEFFCRYVPRLRNTVTQPMPVIPLANRARVNP
jgi:hypothetical protein